MDIMRERKKRKEKEKRQKFKFSSIIKKNEEKKSSKIGYLISFTYKFKIFF